MIRLYDPLIGDGTLCEGINPCGGARAAEVIVVLVLTFEELGTTYLYR
jgi:hypothetical protein